MNKIKSIGMVGSLLACSLFATNVANALDLSGTGCTDITANSTGWQCTSPSSALNTVLPTDIVTLDSTVTNITIDGNVVIGGLVMPLGGTITGITGTSADSLNIATDSAYSLPAIYSGQSSPIIDGELTISNVSVNLDLAASGAAAPTGINVASGNLLIDNSTVVINSSDRGLYLQRGIINITDGATIEVYDCLLGLNGTNGISVTGGSNVTVVVTKNKDGSFASAIYAGTGLIDIQDSTVTVSSNVPDALLTIAVLIRSNLPTTPAISILNSTVSAISSDTINPDGKVSGAIWASLAGIQITNSSVEATGNQFGINASSSITVINSTLHGEVEESSISPTNVTGFQGAVRSDMVSADISSVITEVYNNTDAPVLISSTSTPDLSMAQITNLIDYDWDPVDISSNVLPENDEPVTGTLKADTAEVLLGDPVSLARITAPAGRHVVTFVVGIDTPAPTAKTMPIPATGLISILSMIALLGGLFVARRKLV